MSADVSPDSKCPICLDRFDNVAYLDCCQHRFCFCCVQEWSKTKTECPLCKKPFFSICHTVTTEDDVSRTSENASSSNSDRSTVRLAENPSDSEAWDQHTTLEYITPPHDEGSSSDSTVPAVFPDEADFEELEHGSPDDSIAQVPLEDETPGPSYFYSEERDAIVTSLPELLESSDEDSAWKRTTLQPQLQAGVDSRDSDASSEYHDIAGCVNCYADRAPELTELSSDSEVSTGEEKREDVNKEQSIQGHSWSDREPSRSSSPHSPLTTTPVLLVQSSLFSVVKKTVSKDEQKNKDKIKDPSSQDSDWSPSPGTANACSPCSQTLSRKRKTRSPQDCPQNSDESHGHQPWRKCHSEHQLKKRHSKSRDGSKHRSKRSRRSTPRDSSSSSCESTTSRGSSRSWTYRKGCGQRRSSSRDSDCYYGTACYQSRYQWDYPSCSQKTAGDGSSCSEPAAHCSRKSPSPEFRTQPFTRRTDVHSQMGLHERQDSCYKRCRSSSRSSSRSRSPSGETDRRRSKKPGGKRKCKTRHLENAEKGSTSLQGENSLKRLISEFSDCFKNEGSTSDSQASIETKQKETDEKSKCGGIL